jgi:TPR repeat protein
MTNDYQKAVKKSQLAANQGLGHDPYNLKMSHVTGGAVTTDYQQALNGSRLSVIQGGGYKLGEMYLKGDILTQGPQ